MMWTGVRSSAVARRASCSKKGTSAPGCWKGFSAEPARYSSTLLCAAARAAALTGGAAGRFFFFLAAVFFFAAVVDGEPASRQQPTRAVPSARRLEEHTSELQSPCNLVCRLLLAQKHQESGGLHPFSAGDHPVVQREHGGPA